MNAAKSSIRLSKFATAIGLALFLAALWWLRQSLAEYRWRDVLEHLYEIPGIRLVAAGSLAACGYTCLTFYEFLGMRFAAARISYRRVASTAFIAYAIGHNVGFNTFSGGAIRYRIYNSLGLEPGQIARVIGFGTFTFGLGAAFLVGISLLTAAGTSASVLHVREGLSVTLGSLLIALAAAYFVLAALRRAPIKIGRIELQIPSLRFAGAQLAVACADLLFAAGVLYVLLPQSAAIGFVAFAGLYLLSIAAGVVSSVPGGVGIFESVMLILLPQIAPDRLLGAMIAYRCIYYFAPFALAVAGLAMHELWTHRVSLRRAARLGGTWSSVLAPQLAAFAVFMAGAVLIFSGATPGLGSRLAQLQQFIPLPVLELSHLVGSVIGVALLVLASGLYRRLDGAWWLTVWLLAAGIAASLLKGFDFEEALILSVVMVPLVLARGRFDRRASLIDQRFSLSWVLAILLVLSVAVWLVRFAYRHVPYAGDLWWQFAFEADAPRSLRALLVAAVSLAAYGLSRLLRASPPRLAEAQPGDFDQAADIIAAHGDSGANAALVGDKKLLFNASKDAFIMFAISGRSWVAMGDPVGAPEAREALSWAFLELCDRAAAWPVFYQVAPDNLALYVDLGLSMSKLGEEARVPLVDFSLDGAARADLRQSHRRAERDGAEFRIVPRSDVPAILGDLQRISASWLQAKSGAEKGFSVGYFDRDYLARCDCAVVYRAAQPVAFANLWRGGGESELSVDLMRYCSDAPKGVMDFLFAESMLWGRTQGYAWFNLGMAPLAGLEVHALAPAWHKLGRLVYRYGENFYNFEGLRKYKEKYLPIWRPRYLAAPNGLAMARALFDVTALISGGVSNLAKTKG